MRTFQSEACRLLRQYAPGEPVSESLGASLWVLFASGKLGTRRRRGRGTGGDTGPSLVAHMALGHAESARDTMRDMLRDWVTVLAITAVFALPILAVYVWLVG